MRFISTSLAFLCGLITNTAFASPRGLVDSFSQSHAAQVRRTVCGRDYLRHCISLPDTRQGINVCLEEKSLELSDLCNAEREINPLFTIEQAKVEPSESEEKESLNAKDDGLAPGKKSAYNSNRETNPWEYYRNWLLGKKSKKGKPKREKTASEKALEFYVSSLYGE